MTTAAVPEWAEELSSELHDAMGIRITHLSADRVVGTMPVEGNRQPMGLLHGGASAVLVEGLASMGAVAHARTSGRAAVGVDLNITHIRSAQSGVVTGVATPVHLGSRIAVYEVEITDEQGRRTALGRITCQLV
ncbi:hotdog fold thioesterase [Tessaracoccus rhinocerotis]|uniref:Hotdog fold thioesterase n=1 Tax=Tessaracoccus rhinocerotis TaxID=1689449 RepID=A0A553K2J0_9ACTN|nr:hotdog fold thioesterase [Tessaracoccus rhinocerotis]TRY18904.1 hotdog fold thioesterase [Tessaracoccus rhinocerotis]